MTAHHWLAVRCCCSGAKILGFMSVSDEEMRRDGFTRPVMRITGCMTAPFGNDGNLPVAHFDRVTITLKDFHSGGGVKERAIYSDDRALDFWRDVRGFIEAAPNIDGR